MNLPEFWRDDPGDTADRRSARLAGVPGPADGVAEIEPFDCIGKITHEVPAAELARDGETIYGNFSTASETRGGKDLTSRRGCRIAAMVLAAD